MSEQARSVSSNTGVMGERIAQFDWAASPLGVRARWPAELSATVQMMLGLTTPTAIYWGPDLIMLYNDAWHNQLRVDQSGALGKPAEQVYGHDCPHLRKLFVPDSDSIDAAQIRSSAHAAGLWRHSTFTPITYSDGSVGGVSQSYVPAADLQQASHETYERYKFLERALSHMGDYVFIWGRDRTFVYANPPLESLWGLPAGQYKGKTLAQLPYPKALVERLDRQIEQVLATGEPLAGVTPYTSPSGAEGHYEYFFTPLTDADGEVQFVAGVSRDVAEHYRTSEALRKSEQRYRALFESMGEGFVVFEVLFDENGVPYDYVWVETNPAFERHTGLINAVGRTAREMVPGLEDHWLEIYGTVALSGEPKHFVEHSEAMGRWFEVDAFRVGDPQERKVALLFADITGRKQAEHALREADRRKDEFLATLAHELRNPLAAISSGIEVAKLALHNPDILAKTYPTLERQTQQLVRLVDDLLEVSRITRGTLELRKAPVKLQEIITSATESCAPLFAHKNHSLAVELPENAIIVDADPHRLTQVLTNLLNNASKYSADGAPIELSLSASSNDAIIAVKDCGLGIAAEKLDEIFTMFTQIDAGQDSDNFGLGVGLALAKSLVEMHHGRLMAHSAGIGQGSTFTVRLPLPTKTPNLEQSESMQDDHSSPTNGSNAPHRVLIVDDNADAASTLGMLIEMLGNHVATANSGSEALALGEDFKPRIIFLDLGMPEMDGFATAAKIREQAWGKNTVLVALSGWGQNEDKRKTEAAGFDHHLVKPAELRQLQKLLAEL